MKKDDIRAIQPIYKGMRLRKFTKGDDLTEGVRLTSKTDIGIIFPFERSHEDIVKGIKTILGFSYGRKVFFYWIPKIVRIKEMMFEKKPIRIINKIMELTSTLDMFRTKKSVFFKRIQRNYVYDFSSVLSSSFPEFDNVQKWNSPLAYKNIDNFIIEWLNFVLEKPINKDNKVIHTSMFLYGNGVRKNHDKLLMGFRINTLSKNIVRFINPSITTIPRMIKNNLDNYLPILILRSLVAGSMNYREDPLLTKIYDILKDISIIFYNNRGYGFIYNTSEDDNVKKYDGNQMLVRTKLLFQKLISTNYKNFDLEDEDDDSDIIDENDDSNIIDENGETITKNEEIKPDDEFEEIVDLVVKSDYVDKLVSKNKKIDEDEKEVIKEINEDEEEISPDNELDNEIEDINDEEFEEDEEEIDLNMLDDESSDEKGKDSEDLKKLITDIQKDLVPKQTKAQEQRLNIIKEKYKSIKIDGRSLPEILNDTKIKNIEKNKISSVETIDNSFKESTLVDFEKSYIKNTFEHDIVSTVKSFSKGKTVNLHIVDLKKEDTSDQINNKYTYTFKLTDDRNKTHNIKIDIPKIDEDGLLLIGGNRKILKKQLTLLPIVKTKPDRVMISSNYNKCFIYRHGSTLTKGLSALFKLLTKELVENEGFTYFRGDNEKTNKDYITNIEYDVIASKYYKFIIGNKKYKETEFIFNQKDIRELISKRFPYHKIKENMLPIGINWEDKRVIEIDLTKEDKNVSDYIFEEIKIQNIIPNIYELISSMKIVKRRMYTKIEVQSKDYALIGFLGGLFGLSKIINTENIEVEFTEKKILNDNRLFIKFSDGYLYYKDTNIASSLLLNGLSYMNPEEYTLAEFDTQEPYINYFFNIAKSRNVYKGHTAFKELFIDPITEEVLRDLNLPTDFLELFLYANSLLADNSYTSETNLSNYRVRGYENIATILYKALSMQYRLYKQNSSGVGRISVQQDQILVGLHKSFILENYDATNPINELKSKAIVTFKGPCGVNNDRVFTLEKRSYDFSAIGTMAISSTDGAPVGITKHLTLNPNIISTRGFMNVTKTVEDIKNKNLTNLGSPEELDVPFLNFHDDPKRIGIASAQSKHIIKVKNATIPVISTGMDKVTPYLVGNTYVPKAKDDGKIEKIDYDKKIIIISYKDGTKGSVKFGLDIQRNSSFFFGNNLVPNVKENQKIKKGDILAYENDFFKKDIFGNVRNTQGVLAKIVLHEKCTTDEDSLTITQSLSEKMETSIILRKQISLTPNTNIISYKNIGDHVFKYDPLLVFEESEDDYTAELLQTMGEVDENILASAKQIPKANATGTIVDMKVYFTVPLEELTESLNTFILKWAKNVKSNIKFEKQYQVDDIELEKRLKITKPSQTGTTSRINGAIIPNNGKGVLIEYYIKHDTTMSVGDKATLYANLKAIVAQIIPNGQEPITEDGIVLDGCLSLISVMARMCYSILMGGVITHALVEKSKSIAKEYLESI